ncbi:hypothetical protein ACOW85_001647 [Vibrio parahaemolyticus]|nr:hypothetical protein [Vibrio parahaemolyticus]
MCQQCMKADLRIVEIGGKGFKFTFDASQLTDTKSNIALDKANKELVISNIPDDLIKEIEALNAQPNPISLFDALILAAAIRG